MEQYSGQGGAKSTTRTFSFRLGGLTFGKKKSEALFHRASDRVIMLVSVLPDSNISQNYLGQYWSKWEKRNDCLMKHIIRCYFIKEIHT